MSITKASLIDLNGQELILDADADTSITADTDDQIDIKIAGSDVVTFTDGAITLKGTTPTLTIGDAGAEDTKIVFDGNAQDYYVGLDDSADTLVMGLGSTLGTTPAITIDSTQRVLIGTDSGDSFNADSMLRLGRAGDRIFIQLKTDAGQDSGILFGDVDDDVECAVQYDNANKALKLTAKNGNERLRVGQTESVFNEDTEDVDFRIESDGNANMLVIDAGSDVVLVGTNTINPQSASSGGNEGCMFGSGLITAGRAGGEIAIFNRQTSDGDILLFRKDGTTVGQMAAKDGDVTVGTGDTGFRFIDGSDAITPHDISSNSGRDNAISLGTSGARYLNMYMNGGIYFGSRSNALDDYEEGTWGASDQSGAGLTFTQSHNRYTKIGRVVIAHVLLTYPTTSDTSLAKIGIPFTANADSDASTTGGAVTEQNIDTTKSYTASVNYQASLIIRERGATGLANNELSGKTIRFTITYFT